MENTLKGKSFKGIVNWGLKDIFTGWSKWEAVYAFLLIGIQIGALFVPVPGAESMPTWLKVVSFIVSLSGTICVLLVAKGKITNYFFGFIQTVLGVVVGGYHRLIGETLENAMYLAFQFIGAREWAKNMKVAKEESKDDTKVVKTKKFHWTDWVLIVAVIGVLTYGVGSLFYALNGSFGFTDAFTLIVAVVAQLLMTYRYREQWVIWFALNVVSVWQFYNAGNTSMFALYVALLLNTVYGFYNWTKTAEKSEKSLPIVTQLFGK